MLLNELDQCCGTCDVIGLCAQPFSELCLCTDSRFASLSEEQYIKLANEVNIKNAPKENDFEDDEECCEALNYMHCPIFNVVVEEMSVETLRQLIKEHFDNPIFTSQKHRQMYDCYKKVIERCAMQSEVIKELNDQLSKYDEWEMRQVQARTNPPLKREEIHDMVSEINKHDVVIFDDEDKCYIRLYLDQEGMLYYFCFGDECESLFVFEDNRFYRREVANNV